MAEAVLDASAVLASLRREPGGAIVDAIMAVSAISAVNASEVVATLIDMGDSVEDAHGKFNALALSIVPADAELALDAGSMRAWTRHLGLSLGDRFCLALGRRCGLPVYTADRRWADLAGGVDIRLIR